MDNPTLLIGHHWTPIGSTRWWMFFRPRIAKAFTPDLVLVSAGFDAAPGDPLGEGEERG